ncbi:hypothetical protein CY35_05G013100 [Sphagnum magellanicum]|nr:hypothetical protein CY35_05G013100 [Sphagnum magellanicum]
MCLSTSRFASESLELSSDTEELQDLRSEAFPSKTNKRKRPSDEPESSDVDFEDTDDPLLIAKVKLRPNKAKKPEHVQQIRAIKTKNMQTVEKEDKESNVVNPEAKAGRYQLEVLEKASKENIILYLETGGGKTLIAVLLMKSLAHNLRLKGDKRIVVFLVPTVILVHQVRLFTTDSLCPVNLRLLAHNLEFWLLHCRDHEA